MAIGWSTRHRRWILGLLFPFVSGGSCGDPSAASRTADTPYVLRLDAEPVGSGTLNAQERSSWVRALLRDGLTESRWFRADGDGIALSTQFLFEEQRPVDGPPILRVQLVVEPDRALGRELKALDMELDIYVELERRDETLELSRDLPIAVERAIALLDAKLVAARGVPAEVIALLRDPDPEVVLIALDGVEGRRLRDVADEVLRVVEHRDERIAMRAVECLGVVGGSRHTPSLLRSARLADRAHAHRLYEALARLGGQHARGFLEFAARNEEDPELALKAERALAQVDAEPRATATPSPLPRGHRQ